MTWPTAPSWTPCPRQRADDGGCSEVQVPSTPCIWVGSQWEPQGVGCLPGLYFPVGSWRKGLKEVSLVLGPHLVLRAPQHPEFLIAI